MERRLVHPLFSKHINHCDSFSPLRSTKRRPGAQAGDGGPRRSVVQRGRHRGRAAETWGHGGRASSRGERRPESGWAEGEADHHTHSHHSPPGGKVAAFCLSFFLSCVAIWWRSYFLCSGCLRYCRLKLHAACKLANKKPPA